MSQDKTHHSMERRCEALEAENERLRQELRGFHGQARKNRQAVRKVGGLGWRLLSGPDLDRTMKAWVGAWQHAGKLPGEESAEVLTALARRVIRVGLFGVMLAVVPSLFLMHQNYLMHVQNGLVRDQNAYFQEQNQKISQQLELQIEETYLARRQKLLNALYQPQPGCRVTPCQALAEPRVRQESLHTLRALEKARGPGGVVDLSGALLQGVKLEETRLEGVSLEGAWLKDADMVGVWLEGAMMGRVNAQGVSFHRAKMKGAQLKRAEVQGANFLQADLSGARLDHAQAKGARFTGANLSGASLLKANLKGADLRDANLEGTNLTGAQYDEDTRWPKGFDARKAGAKGS